MKTIAVVLVFLASVAARDYSACLELHYPNGKPAGSVIISAADGYYYVNVDLPFKNWPTGTYSFNVQRNQVSNSGCPVTSESIAHPDKGGDPDRVWVILTLAIKERSLDIYQPPLPGSLERHAGSSIIDRSIVIEAIRTNGTSVQVFAFGSIRETSNKNAKCGEANAMTIVPTTRTTKRTTTTPRTTKRTTTTTKRACASTTKAPDTTHTYRRRPSFWGWCHRKLRYLFGHH